MRVLVWQWGRKGAGPRYAASLAASLGRVPGVESRLSLSAQSELLADLRPPVCDIAFTTYRDLSSAAFSLASLAWRAPLLARRLRHLAPDIAVCAMPAYFDPAMTWALRRLGVPYVAIIHDADPHPGDDQPFQSWLQRRLMGGAAGMVALSDHVGRRIVEQGLDGGRPLIRSTHPPFGFGGRAPPPRAHGGPLRLLSFGRLLKYKGLDLLADALVALGPRGDVELRVVGEGEPLPELAQLAAMPNVRVENRWVPESEVASLLAWSDALVLSHREASQSGVAASALGAGRWIVSTDVGGIREQLEGQESAVLCPPTPQGLAAGIARLIADPPPAPRPRDPRRDWVAAATDLVAALRPLAGINGLPAPRSIPAG